MEGVAGAARKRPLAERCRDDIALVDFRDRGQRDDFPAFLFEDMADQVVFMQPLHDDDDRSLVLFIEARVKRIVEPIVDASSAALRHRIGWLHRVVDQDEVRAPPGKHPADGGRHAKSAARCHKLLQGSARGDEPRRENRLVPSSGHDGSTVSGELIRELLTVRDVYNGRGRTMTQQPGGKRDRRLQRFEAPGWDIDDETTNSSVAHLLQLRRHDLEMPVRQKRRSRVEFGEAAPHERVEVAA